MASFGRLTASAVNGTVDNTLALANFNFDFSLFKVPAPQEFEGVGSALSATRRSQAETGRYHVTARKLGALFSNVLPDTPDLIKAYGKRASDISLAPASRPSGTEADGLFASYAGPDGTTIWAAATSGHDAIKVHLLACMLARIWDSAEATSIWYEIITDRKQQILSELEDTGQVNGSALMAAQQEITRTQLSEWDASARSWLRTADQIKKHQQTQVEVIVKNLRVPVNTKPQVYASVMQAWESALEGTNCLIKGMPQRMQSGEILLGLSSWHIYPDLLVVDASSTYVRQDDPLVQNGGVLTLGLETSQSTCEPGVHWSLPLAHLQYYGEPVLASRSIAMDGSRLTIDEFLQVVLGSVIGGWLPFYEKQKWNGEFISNCAQFLVGLSDDILKCVIQQSGSYGRVSAFHDSWLFVLAEAARNFLHSEGLEHQKYLQLINLGKLSKIMPAAVSPHFGLSTYARYPSLCSKVQDGICALRHMAKQMELDSENAFIRFPLDCGKGGCFGYTTAVPGIQHQEANHTHVAKRQKSSGHTWWIPRSDCSANGQRSTYVRNGFTTDQPLGDPDIPPRLNHKSHSVSTMGGVRPVLQTSQLGKGSRSHYKSTRQELADELDVIRPLENKNIPLESTYRIEWRKFRVYIRKDANFGKTMTGTLRSTYAGTSEMKSLVEKDNIDFQQLPVELGTGLDEMGVDYLGSLKAIASIVKIYKLLPHATISVRVFEQKLSAALWLDDMFKDDIRVQVASHKETYQTVVERILEVLRPFDLTRGQAFSCISLLESGRWHLEPDKLSNVMAISAGNCIYVAAPLLCDPWEMPQPQEIRRIMGNVGRPGIALLVPPGKPRIRDRELEAWKVVNHREFDGKLEDHFQNTSLHLSFTGFSLPVDTGFYGGQDSEVTLIESVVSIHECGKWVADLDILRALENSMLVRVESCSHSNDCEPCGELISLENWTEFLWRPNSGGIFRAHSNWQARLAATTISVAQDQETFVLPTTFCWYCVQSRLCRGKRDRAIVIA